MARSRFRFQFRGLRLDLHEDAGGYNQSVERLDGSSVRFLDVDDSLVRSNLELLSRLLVDEGRTVDRVDLASSGQRNRTRNTSTRSLGMLDDLLRRNIQCLVVVCFHSDSDLHR